MDLSTLTRDELTALRDDIDDERRMRDTLDRAPARAMQVCRDFLDARDRDEDQPAPWVAPVGAHDLYPEGHVVTHSGTTWESTRDANAEEPGAGDGWTQVDGGAA